MFLLSSSSPSRPKTSTQAMGRTCCLSTCWKRNWLQCQIPSPGLAACSQNKPLLPPVPRATLHLISLRADLQLTQQSRKVEKAIWKEAPLENRPVGVPRDSPMYVLPLIYINCGHPGIPAPAVYKLPVCITMNSLVSSGVTRSDHSLLLAGLHLCLHSNNGSSWL